MLTGDFACMPVRKGVFGMMKLGTMSLNVRNTTATAFAQLVYDLGFDVISCIQVRLNRPMRTIYVG